MEGFFPLLLYLEAEWRELEQRKAGEADEWGFFFFSFFFEWDEREPHVEESKKAEDGRREEGANPRSALGWRGAREELADFGNPSFISVKPSSAECRLADITELLTADCLYADCLLDLLHRGPKARPPSHSAKL